MTGKSQAYLKPLKAGVYVIDRDPKNKGIVHVSWAKAKFKKQVVFKNSAQLRQALGKFQKLQDKAIVLLDFSGQDLQGLDFSDMRLCGFRFRNCMLDNANFSRAWLMGTDFTNAQLKGATLNNCVAPTKLRVYPCGINSPRITSKYPFDYFYYGPTRFRSADLSQASLVRARFANGIFRYTNLADTNLNGADMGKSHFHDVSLARANMKDTKITRALFRNTPLSAQQIRESIGPALALSDHNAEHLRRLRRKKQKHAFARKGA